MSVFRTPLITSLTSPLRAPFGRDFSGPLLDLNFLTGTLPAGLVFARASNKLEIGSNGLLATYTSDQPAYQYDATTLACNGLSLEAARTNRVLHNRDLTQAVWVTANMTATRDQVGIDGAANTATRLTATANNATITQVITDASSRRRAFSIDVRRISGTGAIEVTADGINYTTLTGLTAGFTRTINIRGVYASPVIQIRMAVATDEIAVDYVQNEDGGFTTSRILTGAASATRAADSLTYSLAGLAGFSQSVGTVFMQYLPVSPALPNNTFESYLSLNDGTSTNNIEVNKRDFPSGGRLQVSSGIGVTSEALQLANAGVNKVAFTYQKGVRYAVTANNQSVQEILSATAVGGFTQLEISDGPIYGGASFVAQRVTLQNITVNDTNLQGLTV